MVTRLQVLYVEFEKIKGSGTCGTGWKRFIDQSPQAVSCYRHSTSVGLWKGWRICFINLSILLERCTVRVQQRGDLENITALCVLLCSRKFYMNMQINSVPLLFMQFYISASIGSVSMFMCRAVACMSHPCASEPSACASVWSHVCQCPTVLPGWPSMLAKRMSELRVGYISIQADMEWSWPWSWSSSRNFWVKNKKVQNSQ